MVINVNIPLVYPSADTLQGQPLVHLFPGRNVTADPAPPDRSREIVQYR